MVRRQSQDLLYLLIFKSTHRHRTQAKDHRLQQQVLGGVAGLKVYITGAALPAILLGRALVDGCQDENGWRVPDQAWRTAA